MGVVKLQKIYRVAGLRSSLRSTHSSQLSSLICRVGNTERPMPVGERAYVFIGERDLNGFLRRSR